jgi:hypothetical protein
VPKHVLNRKPHLLETAFVDKFKANIIYNNLHNRMQQNMRKQRLCLLGSSVMRFVKDKVLLVATVSGRLPMTVCAI